MEHVPSFSLIQMVEYDRRIDGGLTLLIKYADLDGRRLGLANTTVSKAPII